MNAAHFQNEKRRPEGRLFSSVGDVGSRAFSAFARRNAPFSDRNFPLVKKNIENPAFTVEKCEAKSVCFLIRRLGSKSLLKNHTQVSDV